MTREATIPSVDVVLLLSLNLYYYYSHGASLLGHIPASSRRNLFATVY